MQKIYRKKKQQISRDYICAQGCGKTYGSYAALYTHMKNKHGCLKTLDIKSNNPVKVRPPAKKGRPITKVKQEVFATDEVISDSACKICYEDDCICDSSINESEAQKLISVYSDKKYLKLLNCVSQLGVGQSFTWIRSTQQDYDFISKERLKQLVKEFNIHNNYGLQLKDIWYDYLTNLSKVLDKKLAVELFQCILLILGSAGNLQSSWFIQGLKDSINIERVRQEKKKEWKQFVETILYI